MLKSSPWFQRSKGRDHIIVASHYGAKETLGKNYSAISDCNWLSYHDNKPTKNGRMRISTTYVGRKCEPQKKRYDIAFIARLHPERPFFKPRRDACKWLKNQNKNSRKYTVANCGHGKQCPALAQARMGLHIRGDNLGSNRLMDTLLSETVPVFTDVGQ